MQLLENTLKLTPSPCIVAPSGWLSPYPVPRDSEVPPPFRLLPFFVIISSLVSVSDTVYLFAYDMHSSPLRFPEKYLSSGDCNELHFCFTFYRE